MQGLDRRNRHRHLRDLSQFEEFAKAHDLRGATVVLDSGGGSVLDAIKLGRRWRELRMSTTVGITVVIDATMSARRAPR